MDARQTRAKNIVRLNIIHKHTASRHMHIAITAATFTGNRGGEAMLLSAIDKIKAAFPRVCIHVLSYSPKADAQWLKHRPMDNVFLHSLAPAHIALNWFPMALGYRLFSRKPRPVLDQDRQSIRRLLSVDAVLDLAGVAFMDGREKFLPFNVLTLFPFLLHGVPVWKLSQALGPITSPLNRAAARWTLSRVQCTAARGRHTMTHLKDFGLPPHKYFYAPDTAFTLSLKEEPLPVSQRARDICIIPSALLDKKYPEYRQTLVETIKQMNRQGNTVSLVAHSWKRHTSLPRNNDLPLAERIREQMAPTTEIELIGPDLNALEIKREIAKHRVCVTSRFHGMIAALDTATPCLVIGWSHKYLEVLEDFGLAANAIDAKTLTPHMLGVHIRETLAKAHYVSAHMTEHLPPIREKAHAQFEHAFRSITALHPI